VKYPTREKAVVCCLQLARESRKLADSQNRLDTPERRGLFDDYRPTAISENDGDNCKDKKEVPPMARGCF